MNQSITGTRLVECLGEGLDYSDAMTSFSPFYSEIGLGLDDASGIRHVYLHYNRCTTGLGEPFLALPPALQASSRTATGLDRRYLYSSASGIVTRSFSGRSSPITRLGGGR